MLDSYLKKKKKEGKYFSSKSRGFENKNMVGVPNFQTDNGLPCYTFYYYSNTFYYYSNRVYYYLNRFYYYSNLKLISSCCSQTNT